MIWMRLFWTFVLTLLLYAVVDLVQSSWAAAEKASEAWSGKSSAENQIGSGVGADGKLRGIFNNH